VIASRVSQSLRGFDDVRAALSARAEQRASAAAASARSAAAAQPVPPSQHSPRGMQPIRGAQLLAAQLLLGQECAQATSSPRPAAAGSSGQRHAEDGGDAGAERGARAVATLQAAALDAADFRAFWEAMQDGLLASRPHQHATFKLPHRARSPPPRVPGSARRSSPRMPLIAGGDGWGVRRPRAGASGSLL
jgi:hypothetical protein